MQSGRDSSPIPSRFHHTPSPKEGCAALPNTLPILGELDCTEIISRCAFLFAALLVPCEPLPVCLVPSQSCGISPGFLPFSLLSLGITHAARPEEAVPALLFDRHRRVPMIDASSTAPNR